MQLDSLLLIQRTHRRILQFSVFLALQDNTKPEVTGDRG